MHHDQGVVSFFHVLVGDLDELANRGVRTTSAKRTQEYLDELGIPGFAECSIATDFYESILSIIQAHGIGRSVLFLRYDDNRGFGRKGRIDVWWRGRDRNAELMLLLAHIIRQSLPWECARIRILYSHRALFCHPLAIRAKTLNGVHYTEKNQQAGSISDGKKIW
jgi:hypothetical protein